MVCQVAADAVRGAGAVGAGGQRYTAVAELGDKELEFELEKLPPHPAIVRSVQAPTWASSQGIAAGDELVAVNGRGLSLMTPREWRHLVQSIRPLRLEFARGGAWARGGSDGAGAGAVAVPALPGGDVSDDATDVPISAGGALCAARALRGEAGGGSPVRPRPGSRGSVASNPGSLGYSKTPCQELDPGSKVLEEARPKSACVGGGKTVQAADEEVHARPSREWEVRPPALPPAPRLGSALRGKRRARTAPTPAAEGLEHLFKATQQDQEQPQLQPEPEPQPERPLAGREQEGAARGAGRADVQAICGAILRKAAFAAAATTQECPVAGAAVDEGGGADGDCQAEARSVCHAAYRKSSPAAATATAQWGSAAAAADGENRLAPSQPPGGTKEVFQADVRSICDGIMRRASDAADAAACQPDFVALASAGDPEAFRADVRSICNAILQKARVAAGAATGKLL